MGESLENVLESQSRENIVCRLVITLTRTFVFRGCNVDISASSISDKTFVNFSTLPSGSMEPLLLELLLLNLSNGLPFR